MSNIFFQPNYIIDKFERKEQVPFTMLFLEAPLTDVDYILDNTRTICTVYTTTSGPNNSPDDGQQTLYDDRKIT